MVDGPMAIIEIHDGRQLAAARALAGLGIRELAAAASVTVRTLHRLEIGGVIQVAQKKRHGCVQQIVAALAVAGVELLPQGRIVRRGRPLDGTAGAAAGRCNPGGGRAKRPRFGTSTTPGMMFSTMSGPAGPTRQELDGASARDGANRPDRCCQLHLRRPNLT
jgi:hypothetical protein